MTLWAKEKNLRKKLIKFNTMILPKINPKDWHYEGQWSEPTLAVDFWMHTLESAPVKKIIGRSYVANAMYLDSHYYYWRKTINSIIEKSYYNIQKNNYIFFKNYLKIISSETDNLLKVKKELSGKNDLNIPDINYFFNSVQNLVGVWNTVISTSAGLEKHLAKELEKYKLDLSDLSFLLKYAFEPWINLQHKEMVALANYFKKRKLPSILNEKSIKKVKFQIREKAPRIFKQIENHINKYAWVGTHFFKGSPLTWAKLIREMKEVLKNFPSDITRPPKIKIPTKIKRVILIGEELAYWRMHLTEVCDYALYYMQPQFKKISRKLGVKYSEFYWFTKKEILSALENNGRLNKNIVQQRQKKFGIIYVSSDERIITGGKVDFYLNVLKSKQEKTLDKLKGMVASKGHAQGKVRIVTEQNSIKSFKKGEILVAPETTPDYISAMKIASAIITDIGGLTCHAAIVSRELRKPCIIGTKIATQVLKDGDWVEVDANMGVVKIIK